MYHYDSITDFGPFSMGFPGSSVVKNPLANKGAPGNTGSIPGLGRSPGGRNGNAYQYSCLENPVDRGAWWATIHEVAKSWTWLSVHTLVSILTFNRVLHFRVLSGHTLHPVISISGKASLVMCTPSAFTSLGKPYFSFTFEGQFCQIQFLWLALFFSSSTLNTLPHSLLAYNVTTETPAENLIGAPLWQLAFFLLFSRFSLCLSLVSFITTCFGLGLF